MKEREKNMVFAARLTQQGHKIASMDDLMELYEKSFSVQTVAAMGALPHPTIQKPESLKCEQTVAPPATAAVMQAR